MIKLYGTSLEAVSTLFNELVTVASVLGLSGDGQEPSAVVVQSGAHRPLEVRAEADVRLQPGRGIDHRSVNVGSCLIELLSST